MALWFQSDKGITKVGLGFVDVQMLQMGVCEFVDNVFLSVLEVCFGICILFCIL